MIEQQIIDRMIEASKEDRMRFFAVADTLHLQPKYHDKLDEIEAVKQEWRDMTDIKDYPHIKFPLDLPDWFPEVRFASCWDIDYMKKTLEEQSNEKS